MERGEVRKDKIRVLSITDEKGRGLKFDYEKGGNARLKSITNTKGETVSYEYDGYYLKSVKYPNGEDITYTYSYKDTAGRELDKISVDGIEFSPKTDANDLLISLFCEVMDAYPEYKEYIPPLPKK